jgi:hypothetical protein
MPQRKKVIVQQSKNNLYQPPSFEKIELQDIKSDFSDNQFNYSLYDMS